MRATRAAIRGLTAGCLVVAVWPLAAIGGAHAVADPGAAAQGCVGRLETARGNTSAIDPDELSARQIRSDNRVLLRAEAAAPPSYERREAVTDATATATTMVVDVYAHVLRTRHQGGVSRQRVVTQLRVMSRAFAGRQSPHAAAAPFRFSLAGFDVTVNADWYRMSEGSIAEQQAKRTLHRGDSEDLNLYIGENDMGVLGWAPQPTRLGEQPLMDGVVIARHTLPGGGKGHYSAGDAAVHETGHWLGLFHTFAGKCGHRGDLVQDTPAEARPSYTCPIRRDTCTAPGTDPVHNFMDYSYDSCMNRFTRDQVTRMVRSWNALRAGSGRALAGGG